MIHKYHRLNRESGMALIVALLALLLVSAVGLGMIYMSTTETSINGNYKDTQTSFFAMRAGLEEMRDRMRSDSLQPSPALPYPLIPVNMPGSATPANSIVYITNPALGDNVDPKTLGNPFFDDEFCHEWFAGVGAPTPVGTPCTTAPPATSVAQPYVASMSPGTGTAGSLKYKWVRITLKQNGTSGIPGTPNTYVDSTQPAGSQVCWDAALYQERVSTAMGGSADCNTAAANGYNVQPLYLVTSMAITPSGSRRVGQYETAAFNITPPPAGLALDGPAAVFNPAPNSSQYFANGNNSGAAAYNGPGGPAACPVTTPAIAPAISTGDQQGVTNLIGPTPPGSIPSNRQGNYTGQGGTPSVVNEGSGGGNQLGGSTWSSPAALNNLASELANVADVTYSCGIGTPCNGSGTYGTDAAPQITFVNGDFNFGSNSGAGVLVVTGTLNITGNSSFDGLILVIGQGILNENGGGHGQFNGSIFLAKTNSSTSPYAQLATLASPLIAWNGGGTNGIQYNSCWANIGNNLHYIVVASREEMY